MNRALINPFVNVRVIGRFASGVVTARRLCVFLDAELYLQGIDCLPVGTLLDSGTILPSSAPSYQTAAPKGDMSISCATIRIRTSSVVM